MKTKLWLFILLIGFVFAACEKDDDSLREGPPPHANAKANRVVGLSDATKNSVEPVNVIDLNTDEGIKIVEVTAEIVGENIEVVYQITKEGWSITRTRVEILDYEAINDHDNVESFKYSIPKNAINPIPEDGCYYVAAYAWVVNVLDTFTAGLPETCSLKVAGPVKDGGAYFPEVIISNGDLEGTYPGWCIQTSVPINPGQDYLADVYSSYGNLNDLVEHPENFPRVNWLINQGFVGKESDKCDGSYTYGDLQKAIWKLLTDSDSEDGIFGDVSECRINELIDLAEKHGDFVPGCGQYIAVVLAPSSISSGTPAQNLIIQYPLPCDPQEVWGVIKVCDNGDDKCWTEETAWAYGDRYVERGNWAMFTEYEEGKVVDLIAGQHYVIGSVTFSAPSGGMVTITIELNESGKFQETDENVKIQDYEDRPPSRNPAPGRFAFKGTASGSSFSIEVPENNFYGIHVDAFRGYICE